MAFGGLSPRKLFQADTIPSVARWNLPSLNYRRGMLRIYLVLSVLWIGLMATVSISDRPIPAALATKTQFGDPIDWPAKQPHIWDEKGKPIYLDDKGNPIPSFDDFVKQQSASAAHGANRSTGDWFAQHAPSTDPWEQLARERGAHQSAASEPNQSVKYWETQSALTFAPPIIGYLVLFGVFPWIGRGFRS
jgi:hypothetical protein